MLRFNKNHMFNYLYFLHMITLFTCLQQRSIILNQFPLTSKWVSRITWWNVKFGELWTQGIKACLCNSTSQDLCKDQCMCRSGLSQTQTWYKEDGSPIAHLYPSIYTSQRVIQYPLSSTLGKRVDICLLSFWFFISLWVVMQIILEFTIRLLQTKLDFYTKIPILVAIGLHGAKMS